MLQLCRITLFKVISPAVSEIEACMHSQSVQIWRNFWPVLYRPSKTAGDIILKTVILHSQSIHLLEFIIGSSCFFYLIEIIIAMRGEYSIKNLYHGPLLETLLPSVAALKAKGCENLGTKLSLLLRKKDGCSIYHEGNSIVSFSSCCLKNCVSSLSVFHGRMI